MPSIEPLPCPLCGSAAEILRDGPSRSFQVWCGNLARVVSAATRISTEAECRIAGPWRWSEDEAVSAWNRRTP